MKIHLAYGKKGLDLILPEDGGLVLIGSLDAEREFFSVYKVSTSHS